MKTFFTSDTHFNQERTFYYSMRKMYFHDMVDATDQMVTRWNYCVGPEDRVFHLGDFGDFEVAKRLNGNIHLLYGNYERDGIGDILTPEKEKYFASIHKELQIYDLNNNLLLVHEPSHMMTGGQKMTDEQSDIFALFGHIHEKQKVKRNALNVGVDVHNFTPVSLETVFFYKNAIRNIYDNECFNNYSITY